MAFMTRMRYLLRRSVLEGVRAFVSCRRAALLLQISAVGIVLSYYQIPQIQAWLDDLASFKASTGWPFAMISTALAGGFFPLLVQSLLRAPGWREAWRHLPFFTGFWASQGILIDAFYTLQAHWFGNDAKLQTVISKILADMLGFAPFVAVICMVVAYQWKDCHYSFKRTCERFAQEGFLAFYLPIVIMNWAIWLPAVAAIYCFPLALQVPLMNLTLCLWTILLGLLAGREATEAHPRQM